MSRKTHRERCVDRETKTLEKKGHEVNPDSYTTCVTTEGIPRVSDPLLHRRERPLSDESLFLDVTMSKGRRSSYRPCLPKNLRLRELN